MIDVSAYMISVLKFHDAEDEVIRSSTQFLEQVVEPTEQLIKVINSIDEPEIQVLQKIVDIMYQEHGSSMINQLATQINQQSSVNYICNLIYLMLLNETSYEDKTFSSLLIGLLHVGDITVILSALDKFSKKRQIKDTVSKREIGDALYKIFRGTTDMASKAKLYDYVRKMKVVYAFEKDGRKKKEFTDDENKLMKDITTKK